MTLGLARSTVLPMSPKELIEERLLRRRVLNMLAEALPAREAAVFLSSEEERLNASLARPSKKQIKATLKIVD